MGWAMIAKGLLMMSMKQKVQQVKTEEIYGKAVYLPAIYLMVMAPGALLILGSALLVSAGVVQFYPQYFYPTDLVLTLGAVALLGSGFTYLAFQMILKQVLWREETSLVTTPQIEDRIAQAVGPIRNQFMQEQAMLMAALRERKTKSRDHIQSLVKDVH